MRAIRFLLAALLAGVVIYAVLYAAAPRAELQTEIVIDAPPERVWQVLTDNARYPEWNPFIVSSEGALTPGATIRNTLRSASSGDMTFKPKVLTVTPNRELRWLGRLVLPRVFDGEHYFLLTPEGAGTRMVQGEDFTGFLLWFIDTDSFRPDFEAMNEALKQRSETPAP